MVIKVELTKRVGNSSSNIDKKITQIHDVKDWVTLLNAVYPSIVEHQPDLIVFKKSKQRGIKHL